MKLQRSHTPPWGTYFGCLAQKPKRPKDKKTKRQKDQKTKRPKDQKTKRPIAQKPKSPFFRIWLDSMSRISIFQPSRFISVAHFWRLLWITQTFDALKQSWLGLMKIMNLLQACQNKQKTIQETFLYPTDVVYYIGSEKYWNYFSLNQ